MILGIPPPLIQKDSLRSSLAVAQSKRGARCSPFGALFAVFFKGASDSLVVYLLEKVWTCPMSDFIPAFFFDGRVPGWHGKRCYQWDWPTCFPMNWGIDVEMPAQRETASCFPMIHGDGAKFAIFTLCIINTVDITNRRIGIDVSP